MTDAPAVGLSREELAAELERWDALLWRQANRWHRKYPHVEAEDLHAEIRAGWVAAAPRFDRARGWKFSTFAAWWGLRFVREFLQAAAPSGMHVSQREGLKIVRHLPGDTPALSGAAPGDGPVMPWWDVTPAPEPEPPPEFPADFWDRVDARLDPRSREVVRLRFREGLKLEDAGRRMGLSRQRVQQIEARALDALRRRCPEFADYLGG